MVTHYTISSQKQNTFHPTSFSHNNAYLYQTKTLIQLGRNDHQRKTQLPQLEARETPGIQECCRNDAREIAEIERIV